MPITSKQSIHELHLTQNLTPVINYLQNNYYTTCLSVKSTGGAQPLNNSDSNRRRRSLASQQQQPPPPAAETVYGNRAVPPAMIVLLLPPQFDDPSHAAFQGRVPATLALLSMPGILAHRPPPLSIAAVAEFQIFPSGEDVADQKLPSWEKGNSSVCIGIDRGEGGL